ncbi:hypothetical protein W823_11575 [Williamsia sp. D3]|uniref:Uncharacterized protein n=2 Tax=Nocardiaceae TaxID=85025 RepID=A0A315S013_WILMA|nr:hypothetical protein W823_11575 [Williamsia sp. D3]PVY26910.1 hypothetical protein C7458_11325 [Williamsia marianensis]PZT95359.1 MAG: hypothetical protein DI630_24625 [Gordonia sp. (in: high G+C Gram-positive bacteria)]RKR79773.1 hypothetical protein DFJ75_4910 [Williamsia muralis]
MACAAAVSVAMLAGCGDSEGDSQRPGGVATLDSATSTLVMPYDPVADTTDPRNLVAMATHIFTGQVAALSGTEALSAGSETQYDVTVGVVVKGTVPGTALVNQQGGTVAGVYMSLGGDVPLVPGQWYLFATRILESKGWFTVIPVVGDVPVSEQDARDVDSPPITVLTEAMRANPEATIIEPPPVSSPTLTFPLPTPGDYHPPPPPQPTR